MCFEKKKKISNFNPKFNILIIINKQVKNILNILNITCDGNRFLKLQIKQHFVVLFSFFF